MNIIFFKPDSPLHASIVLNIFLLAFSLSISSTFAGDAHKACLENRIPTAPHLLPAYPWTCGLVYLSTHSPSSESVRVYAYVQADGSWCFSNAGVIVDVNRGVAILIDTLTDENVTRHMMQQVAEEIQGEDFCRDGEDSKTLRVCSAEYPVKIDVSVILNTHGDIDHIYGNGLVRREYAGRKGFVNFVAHKNAVQSIMNAPMPSQFSQFVSMFSKLWKLVGANEKNGFNHNIGAFLRPSTVWFLKNYVARFFMKSQKVNLFYLLGKARASQFFSHFSFDLIDSTEGREISRVMSEDEVNYKNGITPISMIRVPNRIYMDPNDKDQANSALGSAHSASDTFFYLSKFNIVFTGDLVFVNIIPIMWGGPIKSFILALKQMLEAVQQASQHVGHAHEPLFVPGHGPVTDTQGVKLNIEYWKFVLKGVDHCFEIYSTKITDAQIVSCGLAIIDNLPEPLNAWAETQRTLINVYVEAQHRKYPGFKISPQAKLNQIGKQGEYLIRKEIADWEGFGS